MRLLFICHEYPPKQHGGIGSFTKLLAEKLASKGHDVCVIGYGETSIKSCQVENGVEIVRLPLPKRSKNKSINLFYEFKNRWKFQQIVQEHVATFQAEIVETYEWTGPVLFKPKGVKFIVRLHGSNTANNEYMEIKRHPIVAYFEKRTIRQADAIFSVSNHIANITQQSFGFNFRYTTIYNGVDTSIFQPVVIQRDLSKIVLVGRMHPYKGFDQLFACMNQLFALNKEVHFEIICSIIESYKTRLLAMVNENFHNRIQFIGRIPNDRLNQHYSSANLTILPSLSEAFPLIPLESMACETPVMISDRFSAKEIITDGVDGFLVDVMDPVILAQQIANILADQERIENMRPVARMRVQQHFDINQIIEENCTYYQSVITNV